MKFRQIEAFRALMSYGSVTQAAASLHVTQPAVSRLLADFEAELGISLFRRERGRLQATPEAQLLFQESNFAFSGMERLREAAKALLGLHRGRIRMVAETAYAQSALPRLAAAYHAEHRDVHIELDIGPSARIAEWVELAWYDLGLVVLPVAQSGIAIRQLARLDTCCVMPLGHRLARRETVPLEELGGEPFVSLVADAAFRHFVDRPFRELGVDRDIRIEVRTQHAAIPFVAAGLGVAIIDEWIASDVTDSRVAMRPIEPEVGWDLGLILPLSRPQSLPTQSFVDYLTVQAGSL